MGRRRLVVLAALTGSLVTGAFAAAPAGATAGSGYISPWALQNENPNANTTAVPQAQAVTDAKNFNGIIAHVIAYQNDVSAMKAANSSVELLVYMNATFAQSYEGSSYPEADYAHTASGARIINVATGNFLMNPNNSDWIATRVAECKSYLTQSHYDGCYLDLLGMAPITNGYVNGTAIDPATNKPWTKAQWLAATAALAAQVRAGAHSVGKLAFGNGLNSGPLYFASGDPTKQIVDNLDGGIAEAWMRLATASAGAWPTLTAWQQNVNMITSVQGEGKPLWALVKMWASASSTVKNQWFNFSLASFLLATNGQSQFFWSPSSNTNRTTPLPDATLALGTATAAYGLSRGVYQRPFTGGLVLVNPGTATVTVPLGATYYTSSHQPVTTLTMGPHTGDILTTH